MSVISEGLFTTDSYNKPMVLKDKDALAILLLRLLIMVPGTNRQHTEMGVDIRGRYEYSSEDEIDELNDEISKQIEIYLPNYASGAIVNCSSENRVLKVSINVDGTVFNFSSGTELDDNEISLNTDLQ